MYTKKWMKDWPSRIELKQWRNAQGIEMEISSMSSEHIQKCLARMTTYKDQSTEAERLNEMMLTQFQIELFNEELAKRNNLN